MKYGVRGGGCRDGPRFSYTEDTKQGVSTMNAPSIVVDDVDDELARLVADIRARGAGRVLPRPSNDAISALVTRLRAEEPMSADELAEHERQWRAMEEEMRIVEHEDEQRDKLR
jgi:hypothetical protein